MQPLLEASNKPIDAEPVSELAELREQLFDLNNEVASLRDALQAFRNQVAALQTGRVVFGGAAPPSQSATPSEGGVPVPHNRAAWEAWKEQLPSGCARIIDALLIQPLTPTQMISICKMHQTTVSKNLIILKRNGLVENEGRLVRLKRL